MPKCGRAEDADADIYDLGMAEVINNNHNNKHFDLYPFIYPFVFLCTQRCSCLDDMFVNSHDYSLVCIIIVVYVWFLLYIDDLVLN